jgi:hypothetical protein
MTVRVYSLCMTVRVYSLCVTVSVAYVTMSMHRHGRFKEATHIGWPTQLKLNPWLVLLHSSNIQFTRTRALYCAALRQAHIMCSMQGSSVSVLLYQSPLQEHALQHHDSRCSMRLRPYTNSQLWSKTPCKLHSAANFGSFGSAAHITFAACVQHMPTPHPETPMIVQHQLEYTDTLWHLLHSSADQQNDCY